jgi:tetratricopeptide (TPR) repeat protein
MLFTNLLRHLFRSRPAEPVDGERQALEEAAAAQRAENHPRVRAICADILSREPRNARAHHFMGTACARDGDLENARAHLALAVELTPDFAEGHVNLGNVHKLRGDARAAVESFRAALRIDPESGAAAYNLGMVLKEAGRKHEAVELLLRAHAAAPRVAAALWELVMLLTELDRFEEARDVTERACAENPGDAVAAKALGVVLQHLYDPHAALDQYDRAIALGPLDSQTHALRGIVLQELMQLDAAIAAHDRAIELDPKNAVAQWRRAVVYMLRGEFVEGWRAYELRLLSEGRAPRKFPCPRWRGEPLGGKTILVHAEQGLGDEIMFASCVPDLAAAGGRCIIDCHSKLRALFARSFPHALVHAGHQSDDVGWLASFPAPDYEIPAGSLPLHLRQSAEAFPRHSGYLTADPSMVARWRERLSGLGRGLKVGISWRGGTATTRAPLRSLTLARLGPILRMPDAHFVNLQYATTAEDIEGFGAGERKIQHWPDALDDYDETAALVCALDLVISVCTAVVHLAGALGRPAWVMAPFSPEWRYGHAGSRMAWYPSVTLFRQPRYNEWDPVIAAIAAGLAQHARTPA